MQIYNKANVIIVPAKQAKFLVDEPIVLSLAKETAKYTTIYDN